MKRTSTTAFVCNDCGQDYTKWVGKCTNCGGWNTIAEIKLGAMPRDSKSRGPVQASAAIALADVAPNSIARIPCGSEEIDRVLGGGVVPGGVVLLGGDPGIGKSTLLLQLMSRWAADKRTVLYVSGEESVDQVSMRARRLGVDKSSLLVMAETSVDAIMTHLEKSPPHIVVVDSIQTMVIEALESAAGSVAQVRESAAVLVRYAKRTGTAVFLVGHVTKEGTIAGPRVLEHMVDTVLYFEGDSQYHYRIVRAVKNRFGPAGEIAIFSMTDRGLSEVRNPSEFFLVNRDSPQAGLAVAPVLEGSRILVVELQALVNKSHFGMPQRVASGVNPKKLSLLMAVLERHGSIVLGDHDIFFNIAAGLTVDEPSVDVGIVAAVISSFRNKPLKLGQAFLGEIGLSGEIRAVSRMNLRLKELARLGIKECIVPRAAKNAEWVTDSGGVRLNMCANVGAMSDVIF